MLIFTIIIVIRTSCVSLALTSINTSTYSLPLFNLLNVVSLNCMQEGLWKREYGACGEAGRLLLVSVGVGNLS